MASFSLNGYEIALLVVVAYGLVVYALYRAGWIGKDRTLSLLGPALMIKTRRGRDFIERVGRARRFWSAAGDAAIALAAIAMVGMVVLLLIDAVLAFRISAAQAPSVQEALGIPGINPIIPIGYGLVALVIGVVLHELFHGFVARSQQIGVKTLGVLWCVVPVGAFVEQDDRDMEAASRRRRDRVAAAGVLANFVLAIVFFALMAAVVSSSVAPNANGVGVLYVVPNTPAQNASIVAGDIITEINGTPTTTNAELESLLGASTAGENISVQYYSIGLGGLVATHLTLEPLSAYTGNPSDAKKGFLGIALSFLTPAQLVGTLTWPPGGASGPWVGAIDWLVLPIAGLEPVSAPVQSFFHTTGPFAGANPDSFWIGVNLLYWLAWMNFLLGASNALPLIPLDGGLLVRDYAAAFAKRLRRSWTTERADRFGGTVAISTSFLVLLLIVWQFVAPRL